MIKSADLNKEIVTNVTNLIQFQLDSANTGFITKTLAENLYSNRFSFVREIVSNGIDAINRAGKGHVIVSLNKIPGSYNHIFSVKDTGTGMNPEEFIRFISFGASDKKDKEGELGYWGLGSKSPFAYTNTFLVVTVKNGVKYSYTLTKGNDGYAYTPAKEENTVDENGTTIFINIPDNDVHTLISHIESELRYMEGVVFQTNLSNLYGDKIMKMNTSKVFKFKNFQFNQTETTPVFLLNGVRYPIDWSHFKKIEVPLGINIPMDGSVFPTPSREGLKYTPEAVKVLTQCINNSYAEFLNIVKHYLDNKIATKFADFLKFAIEFKKEYQVSIELLPNLNIPVTKGIIKDSGFTVKYIDHIFTNDLQNFHFENRLEAVFNNYVVVGKYTNNKFVKTDRPFSGDGRRRYYGSSEVSLYYGLFNSNGNLNLDNIWYLDKPLDRRTNSYYSYNDKGYKTYYLIEKVRNFTSIEKYFEHYTTLYKELVTDQAREEHFKLFETLSKMVEEAIFTKRYSDTTIPDGWKMPRVKSTGVKSKEEITFYEQHYRKTRTLDQIITQLDGKKLVYGLMDETNFASFDKYCSVDYNFMFFAKTTLVKVLKGIKESGKEIEVLSQEDFLRTDDAKVIAEQMYYTALYKKEVEEKLNRVLGYEQSFLDLFDIEKKVETQMPINLLVKVNYEMYPFNLLKPIITKNSPIWDESEQHQQIQDWLDEINLDKLKTTFEIVDAFRRSSEMGMKLCGEQLKSLHPNLDDKKIEVFLKEYFYC